MHVYVDIVFNFSVTKNPEFHHDECSTLCERITNISYRIMGVLIIYILYITNLIS
jgi:hypothetical protein